MFRRKNARKTVRAGYGLPIGCGHRARDNCADDVWLSDQAPGWLREATVGLDSTFGFPVLRLIKAIAAA